MDMLGHNGISGNETRFRVILRLLPLHRTRKSIVEFLTLILGRWSTSGNVRKLTSLHQTDSLRCAYKQDENAPVLRMTSLSAHKPEPQPPAMAFYTVTIQSDYDMNVKVNNTLRSSVFV